MGDLVVGDQRHHVKAVQPRNLINSFEPPAGAQVGVGYDGYFFDKFPAREGLFDFLQ